MAIRLAVPFLLAIGYAAAAIGQVTITLNPVELAGTVVQIGPRAIMVKAANGQNWILNLGRDTKLKITGTAEREMLTQGACVRFTAEIDKRTCRGQEKIDKLTIFTETEGVPERTLGVERAGLVPNGDQAAGPAGPAAAQPGQAEPGVDLRLNEEPGGATPNKRRGAAAKADSVPDVASYDICAQILGFHAGKLTVSVQNRFFKPKIVVDVSPDAQIGLDLGDRTNLSLVEVGDKISAEGYYVKPGNCELVKSVEIALSKPLAPPGSHPHHPRAVAGGTAAAQPTGKAKPAADANSGKKASASRQKPAAEGPADPLLSEPASPADSGVGTKPPAKLPEQAPDVGKPPKTPPDDDKDVFERKPHGQ